MDVYLKGGPVFRLTHQGSVPLTPSDPIVYAKNLATLCTPSTPKVWQLLVRSTNEPIKASSGASLLSLRHVGMNLGVQLVMDLNNTSMDYTGLDALVLQLPKQQL